MNNYSAGPVRPSSSLPFSLSLFNHSSFYIRPQRAAHGCVDKACNQARNENFFPLQRGSKGKGSEESSKTSPSTISAIVYKFKGLEGEGANEIFISHCEGRKSVWAIKLRPRCLSSMPSNPSAHFRSGFCDKIRSSQLKNRIFFEVFFSCFSRKLLQVVAFST